VILCILTVTVYNYALGMFVSCTIFRFSVSPSNADDHSVKGEI